MNTALVNHKLFSNKDLSKLFIPLIVEQFLEFSVGLISSIMIAAVSEAAVSGVSLVEFVMALLISIFAALATGGAVIAGQFLGNKQENEARKVCNQLIWLLGCLGLIVMLLIYLMKNFILHGLFGQISEEVYGHANTYLMIVALSIPALALYNAGAVIFRTMGNSKLPMKIMLYMNILNVVGNVLFVYLFDMGTSGIAISTLASRLGAAGMIIFLAFNPKNILYLQKTFRHKFDLGMIKRILAIGVPFGLENGMFYFGRLLVLSLVSTFGTAAIAANSVGGTIVSFQALPGMAIGLGLTVIVARCAGANDYEQARYYTKKIILIIYIAQIISSIVILLLLPAILNAYDLSEAATLLTTKIVWSHAIVMMLIWPLGNTLPVVFRASGDATYPMKISMLTMIFCRIALAYAFVYWFHMDMFATWIAIYCDWLVKGIIFVWRYVNGKWTKFHTIRRCS
ncbi:MATE family efflux transporter [Paenibacillus sp. FSL H7-0357]|uniref:MATE family efflux transporter n=1 Tax=Paenibacillus sp. FSL H7-0357 TaxID=1536774 RepID=UPI000AB84300|nr:MATE family efflux transporter [Paenibacillus sp. FSL H7-0357]